MIHDKFIGRWCFPLDDSLLEQSARRGEKYDFNVIASYIKEKMQFDKNDVALDLCCGNAVLTGLLAPFCKEIHGVDHSEMLLGAARKLKAAEKIDNLHLHCGDALKAEKIFGQNFFDKAYCYFAFQYFGRKKREKILSALSEVTKPGGLIFIGDIPDKTRMRTFYKSRMKFYREKISRLLRFKEGECNLGWWVHPEEITNWCRSRGLNVSALRQPKHLVHCYYRFDVLIKNTDAKPQSP